MTDRADSKLHSQSSEETVVVVQTVPQPCACVCRRARAPIRFPSAMSAAVMPMPTRCRPKKQMSRVDVIYIATR